MKMRRKITWTLSAALALGLAGSSSAQQTPEEQQQQDAAAREQQTNMILEQWEDGPREKARELIERYGQPQEFTQNRFIWHDGDWWKRTEIVNEEIPHNFPEEHHDFLYQTVDYNVPEEHATDVVGLSGSLIIDRTKGELTSRCDTEQHNLIALNLAHQIVEGQQSPEGAKDVFAQARLEGQHQDLAERLMFSPEALDPEPGDPGVVYGARPEQEEQEEEEEEEQLHPFFR